MANLTKDYWNSIGDTGSGAFGIGSFGDGGDCEVLYRHYLEIKHLNKILKFNKSMKVLELGCGAGRFAYSIAPYVDKYVGIDYSLEGIQIAKEVCENAAIDNVDFIQASIIDFDYSEKFDVIYFGGVIQYLNDEDIKKTLTNLKNFIKEDTIIIDRSSVRNNVRHIADSILYYCIYRTPREIEILFKEADFKLIYRKRSYRFLRCGNFLKKHYDKVQKFKPVSFIIMNYVSLVFDKFIYSDLRGNYLSHDFFVFKRGDKI
ncbi:class I SAM-dependent methyltransferase [Clostridium botulinum]|uniref:class I SAM-dependent methyltransferase n=1 Tax=Clostridium botulinum TaxID=1491 RepID=UPI001C9A5927|nr:class I SAM-dependent methyltransferase [Clostridium botulinum]MBY6916660.1 class I SAM-dependent methyltransferase [Clostridium botulinum]